MWIIQVKPLIQPRGFTKTHGFFGQVVFTHGISHHPGSPKPISSKGLSSSNFRGDFSWFFYPFLCARSWIFRCLFKIFDAYDVCKMHYVDIVESEKRYCNPTHLDPTFHQNMFNQNPSSYLTKLPFLPTRTVSANLISRIVESDCSELLPLLPFWDTIHTLFRCTFIKLASIYPSSHSSIISGKWLKGNDPFGGSSHPLPWFHKATVDRRNTIPNAGMYPKPCKKWDNHHANDILPSPQLVTLPDFSHPPVGLPAPVHPGHHPPVPTIRVPDGSPRLGITPRRGQTVGLTPWVSPWSFCDVQKFLQVYILEIYHTWMVSY